VDPRDPVAWAEDPHREAMDLSSGDITIGATMDMEVLSSSDITVGGEVLPSSDSTIGATMEVEVVSSSDSTIGAMMDIPMVYISMEVL